MLVLLQAALALNTVPLLSGRRLPLAPRRAPCRCSRVRCDFSPAYDTTIRCAAPSKPSWLSLRPAGFRRLLSAPEHATDCLKHRPAWAAAPTMSPAMRSHSSFRRRYAAVDWAQNLRSLPGSLILRRIKSPLLFNIGITSLICLLHSLYGPWPAGIALPHTLLSSALGLLLVFRTNAAYGRFWEARAQWGVVTTECRSNPNPNPNPSPNPNPNPNPYPNPNPNPSP